MTETESLPVAYEIRTYASHTLSRTQDWDMAVADLEMHHRLYGEDVELVTVHLAPGQGWVRAHAWGHVL